MLRGEIHWTGFVGKKMSQKRRKKKARDFNFYRWKVGFRLLILWFFWKDSPQFISICSCLCSQSVISSAASITTHQSCKSALLFCLFSTSSPPPSGGGCCSSHVYLRRLETVAQPPSRGVVPLLGPLPVLMELVLPLQPTQLFICHRAPQTIDFEPFLLMSLTRSPIKGDGKAPPSTPSMAVITFPFSLLPWPRRSFRSLWSKEWNCCYFNQDKYIFPAYFHAFMRRWEQDRELSVC